MKKIIILILIMFSFSALAELKVAEEELNVKKKIVFTNYRGPIQKSDKVEDIYNIGYYLAERMQGNYAQLRNKYAMRRILSTNQLLLSADIFSILPDAKVNHIKNVRRILTAYLQKAFHYKKKTAQNIALFIVYYNALHRGDMEFINLKYAPEVLSSIDANKVGITANYKTWPGNADLLIPIAISDLYGQNLGNRELYKEATKVLGKQPDKGVNERSKMLDTRKKELAEKQSKLTQEQYKLNKKMNRVEKDIETIKQGTPSDERRQKLEGAQKKQEELNKQQEKLTQEQQKLREEREGLKKDQTKLEKDMAEVNYSGVENSKYLYFLKSLQLGKKSDSARQLNSIDKALLEINRTKGNITGQNISLLDTDTVITVYTSDKGKSVLTAFDGETLDILKQSKEKVYSHSKTATDDGFAYAIVGNSKKAYIGKFNDKLELVAKSQVLVQPETDIIISKEYIFVTGIDKGNTFIAVLNKDSLEVKKNLR